MEVPKGFAPKDNREKLFYEMLEKNSKREAKLESIEDLVLQDVPDEVKRKCYEKIMQPRYAKNFNDIDVELDYLHIGLNDLPKIDWIKQVHVTNIDIGLYKLDILVIEGKSENKLRHYYEGMFNYEKGMNEGEHNIVKYLVKDKYAVLLFVPYDNLRLSPVLLNKVYDYYRNKFAMKKVNVKKVVELV